MLRTAPRHLIPAHLIATTAVVIPEDAPRFTGRGETHADMSRGMRSPFNALVQETGVKGEVN